jgi:hypothetical protein
VAGRFPGTSGGPELSSSVETPVEPMSEPRPSRGPIFLALAATALLLVLAGWGLWRLTSWLEPPPLELPPEALRGSPGLQRFVPSSDRRLLAKLEPRTDLEEAPLVPPEHPFAKTSVTGRVYDMRTQEGVADAEVRVKARFGKPKLGTAPSGEVVVRTRTDGSFALKGLPPGIFTLHVSAAGYVPVDTGIEKYSAVEDDDGFDVGLIPGRAVEGRVLSAAGAPVPGAEVFLLDDEGSKLALGEPTITDPEGRFVIDPVTVDAFELFAHHPEHGSAARSLETGTEPVTAELRLSGGATCEGVVRGPQGPIAGASIVPHMLSVDDGPFVMLQPERARRAITTGPDGRFRWVSGPRGSGAFVTAPGFVRAVVTHRGEGECRLELELEPAANFRGQILSADGQPVERARIDVVAVREGDGDRAFASAESDADGRFELRDARPVGPYELRILHPEHPPFFASERSLDGERIYRLESSVRLLGKLVDAKRGGPITRYHYEVAGPMRRRGEAFSISGSLEVTALIPGHYQVRIEADGYEPTTAEIQLQLGDSAETTIRLAPGGAIVGRVNAPPASGLVVQAWLGVDELAAEAAVNADGNFSLNNLAHGDYTLRVFGHDGDDMVFGTVAGVQVESGEVTQGVEVRLTRETSPDHPATRPVF